MNKWINRLRYRKVVASAIRNDFLEKDLRSEGYYSQSGQDKWIAEVLLPEVKNGFFVDIGAHDGESLSNTLYLEKLGWSGIAIEPNPVMYDKLVDRRNCIAVNGAVSDEEGVGMFRVITGYSNMLSGLIDGYSERHLERIEREISEHGGTYKDIEVRMLNLNHLLEKYSVTHVDYLSIDVEGFEMQILKSIDFCKVNVGVLSVENNYNDHRIPQMLSKRGFELHAILGADNIFINASI